MVPQQQTRPSSQADSAVAETTSTQPAINVQGLSKVYKDGDESITAVDDLNLEVEPGTVVGLLGPNGAGKTTAIKSMLGLVEPTEGQVEIAGVDVTANPRAGYRQVGAMLEGARNVYWRLTVKENLRFFAALGGSHPNALEDRHERLLDYLDLTEKADVPVKELSRGMKQKVSLAATLARNTAVAFLDEPTLGLDVESSLTLRRELRRLAAEQDTTIILSSHDMDVIETVCDRVVILSGGRKIADDDVDALIEVFRTQSYEITLDHLPTSLENELSDQFGPTTVDLEGEHPRIDVQLPDRSAFYDLVDCLERAGVTVVALDAVEPDLEDVFLEVTEGALDEGDSA